MDAAALLPVLLLVAIPLGFVLLTLNAFLRNALVQLAWMALHRALRPLESLFRDPATATPRFYQQTLAQADVSNPAWLSHTLSQKAPGTRVETARAERMGHDMGNASLMFRVHVQYAANPHRLPDVFIVKLPKDALANRVPFTVTRMNEMETLFYATTLCDELKSAGVELPRGFGGRYDSRGGAMFSVMEDVTKRGAQFQTERRPVTEVAVAERLVAGIAAFHAPLFDAHERFDSDLSWVVQQNDPVLCMTGEFFQAGWSKFLERLGSRVSDDIKRAGPRMPGVAQQLHDYMGLAPFTLVHGDCHLENAYLVQDAKQQQQQQQRGETRLGLYDMQLMRRAKGALDVASFVGGSIAPEILGGGPFHNDGEIRVLRAYFDELCRLRSGGDALQPPTYHESLSGPALTYTFDRFLADYRFGLALLFVWNVAAALAVPFDTHAATDYDAYAERLIRAVDRNAALDLALWYLSVPGVSDRLALRGRAPPLEDGVVPPVERCVPGVATHGSLQLHRAELAPLRPRSLLERVARAVKFRVVLRATMSREGYHGHKTTDVPHAVLEGHHPVDFARGTPQQNHAFDSYYVSGFAAPGSSSPSFALRWCRRFHEEDGEVWLAVKVPGKGVFVWPDHPTTQCLCRYEQDKTVVVQMPPRGGGGAGGKASRPTIMRLTCVDPMVKWRVQFTGELKNQATGELVHGTFDLSVDGDMPHYSFGTHVSPTLVARALSMEPFSRELFDELRASHQEHYEQFSVVTGALELSGGVGRRDVLCRGMRDRAFGMRDWGYMQRYVATYFWAGNDPVRAPSFQYTMASLPTMTRGKFGYVAASGDAREAAMAVSGLSGDMATLAPEGRPPRDWALAMESAGRHYLVRGVVEDGDSVGLDMGPGGMWITFRFATYALDWVEPSTGELKHAVGVGGSEFGYRFAGVEPYRPKKGDVQPPVQHGPGA